MKGDTQSLVFPDDGSRIRLELDIHTLRRLLGSGLLCASDVRCLDCDSKHCVWKLCLQTLSKNIRQIECDDLPAWQKFPGMNP